MKNLIYTLCLVYSSSLLAEAFYFPTVDPVEKLQEVSLVEPPLCLEGGEDKLKDENDPECQIYLGWGHTRDSHYYLKNKNQGQGACGIGMGCNSGDAGVGDLKDKNKYWRFQRGSNGTYRNYEFQGTQNGGLNPVIFRENDVYGSTGNDYGQNQKYVNFNSYLGFMRLTQYHWLQLHNYAQDELLGKKCSKVILKLVCPDGTNEQGDDVGDLDNRELEKRLFAFEKKLVNSEVTEFQKKYKEEMNIMNRVEPLKGCFSAKNEYDGIPKKCNETVGLDQKTKMNERCQKWVKKIQDSPQQDWNTPEQLNVPEKYDYPAAGPIN